MGRGGRRQGCHSGVVYNVVVVVIIVVDDNVQIVYDEIVGCRRRYGCTRCALLEFNNKGLNLGLQLIVIIQIVVS